MAVARALTRWFSPGTRYMYHFLRGSEKKNFQGYFCFPGRGHIYGVFCYMSLIHLIFQGGGGGSGPLTPPPLIFFLDPRMNCGQLK